MGRRVAVVADVHVGNHQRHGGAFEAGLNDRCREVIQCLRAALYRAHKHDCEAFVVAGDLLDVSRPRPQVLAALQEAIGEAAWHANEAPWVHLLVGNHEQVSSDPGDHALGVLRPVANIVEAPEIEWLPTTEEGGSGVLMVPYRSEQGANWLERALDETLADVALRVGGQPRELLLVMHLGIEDGRTAPWLKGSHDSIRLETLRKLCDAHEISAVVAGNWHDYRSWTFSNGLEVVQAGALVPTGWDNPSGGKLAPKSDLYGSIMYWDPGRKRGQRLSRDVVPGPRFLKTSSVAEVRRVIASAYGNRVYSQVVASPDAARTVEEHFRELGIQDFEVVIDAKDVRRRIEQASLSARDAATTDRAVAEYVARAFPTGGEVAPEEVLRLCRGYVAGRRAEWNE